MAAPTPVPASADERIPVGTVLDGRYRIDGLLGQGGMGQVYRGEHVAIGRPVAIKVLHADLNRNRDASARFQRETIASARLDHPNIVNVSDSGMLEDGAPYMVMEVLEGEPLGDRLQRERHLPWREALVILRGVLCGLSHAHEKGVVHRDIKPDNVFLTRKDGELTVKILDFGIAKLYAGNADDPASTRAGLTVGTPAYLSPEQAVGGEITPASDLYSATVMLFEMLAGRAPFEDKDPLAMLGAHVSRPPPHVGDIAPGIELPFGLEEIIQAGLAKASVDRIQSATQYLGYVDAVLAAPQGSASPEVARELLGIMPAASAPATRAAAPADSPLANVSDQSLLLAVDQLSELLEPARAVAVATPMPAALAATAAVPDAFARTTPMPASAEMSRAAALAPASVNDQSIMITVEPYRPPTEPTAGLPPQARAVSLADAGEPIPRRWIWIGAIVLGIVVVAAIVLAIVKRDEPATTKPAPGRPAPSRPTPSKPTPSKPAPSKPAPAAATVREPESDREIQLKALLHDLQNGKTCDERRAIIPKLVALRDPRAIEPLKKARNRMYGGVLGFGSSNANACLVKDANAAVKTLGAIK